ncbi:MAG: hypothetical protein GX020_00025 [Firmicutes bacterium]|nr:hypothetical protein [Bacillota bacterium]
MTILNINTEKPVSNLSIIVIVFVVLLSIAIFSFFYLPLVKEANQLRNAIDEQRENQSLLFTWMEREQKEFVKRPALERMVQEYQKIVPAQQDIQVMVDNFHHYASIFGLQVLEMELLPLREGARDTWVTLLFKLEGDYPSTFYFLDQVSKRYQTASFRYIKYESTESLLELTAEIDIFFNPSNDLTLANWQPPGEIVLLPSQVDDRFGVPSASIENMLQGEIKILGVVSAGSDSRILVSENGVLEWKTIGDQFGGFGVIRSIENGSLKIDINGLILELNLGGK